MFEIPDDDSFWEEDFLIESKETAVEQMVVSTIKSGYSTSERHGQLSNAPLTELLRGSGNQKGSLAVDMESPKTTVTTKTPRDTHGKRCHRKFPGPAGNLPPSTPSNQLNAKSSDTPDVKSLTGSPATPHLNDKIYNLTMSQTPPEDVFASLHWKEVMADLGSEAQTIINKFSIKSMLLKASRKLLHRGKIPLLIGVLESLHLQGSDASFVIRDLSGKMNGSLHRDLIKDPTTALEVGSVLVLRQVSVISPSSRTHYLNVTPGNVILIYSNKKGADVLKRTFPTSPLVSDSKSDTKDSPGTPSLKQVIEESEQELNASIRNFNHRVGRGSARFSPSTSTISEEFNRGGRGGSLSSPYRLSSCAMNPRFDSPSSAPNSSFSSRARGTFTFQRPRVPNAASVNSNQATTGGLLFRSTFSPKGNNNPSLPSGASIQNRHNLSSQNPMQSCGNVSKQTQFLRPAVPPLYSSTSNFMTSGAKAVRNSSSHPASNSSPGNTRETPSVSAQCHQTKYLNTSTGLQINSSNKNATRNQANLSDYDCNFDDDFPDDEDDHEILQLCDFALSQSDSAEDTKNDKSNHVFTSDFQVNRIINEDNNSQASTNVIDQLFNSEKEFLKEPLFSNSTTLTSSNLTKNQELTSDGKCHSVLSNSATPSSGRAKFTFKRSASCLESPSNLVPAKRTVDQLKHNFNSTFDTKSEARPKLLEVNTNSALSSIPTNSASALSSSVSARDDRIQLGRSATESSFKSRDVQANNLLPEWDDDLNDDLLSQLSDDF